RVSPTSQAKQAFAYSRAWLKLRCRVSTSKAVTRLSAPVLNASAPLTHLPSPTPQAHSGHATCTRSTPRLVVICCRGRSYLIQAATAPPAMRIHRTVPSHSERDQATIRHRAAATIPHARVIVTAARAHQMRCFQSLRAFSCRSAVSISAAPQRSRHAGGGGPVLLGAATSGLFLLGARCAGIGSRGIEEPPHVAAITVTGVDLHVLERGHLSVADLRFCIAADPDGHYLALGLAEFFDVALDLDFPQQNPVLVCCLLTGSYPATVRAFGP